MNTLLESKMPLTLSARSPLAAYVAGHIVQLRASGNASGLCRHAEADTRAHAKRLVEQDLGYALQAVDIAQ